MTKVESYHKIALSKLKKRKIQSLAAQKFVKSIKDYQKKDLKKLSNKQFMFLREIAEKNI